MLCKDLSAILSRSSSDFPTRSLEVIEYHFISSMDFNRCVYVWGCGRDSVIGIATTLWAGRSGDSNTGGGKGFSLFNIRPDRNSFTMDKGKGHPRTGHEGPQGE